MHACTPALSRVPIGFAEPLNGATSAIETDGVMFGKTGEIWATVAAPAPARKSERSIIRPASPRPPSRPSVRATRVESAPWRAGLSPALRIRVARSRARTSCRRACALHARCATTTHPSRPRSKRSRSLHRTGAARETSPRTRRSAAETSVRRARRGCGPQRRAAIRACPNRTRRSTWGRTRCPQRRSHRSGRACGRPTALPLGGWDVRQLQIELLDQHARTVHVVGAHCLVRALLDAPLAVELVVVGVRAAKERRQRGIEFVDPGLHAGASLVRLHELGTRALAERGVKFLFGHRDLGCLA